mgnify:CR=1 FL=1
MHIESLISESRTLIIAGERTREGVLRRIARAASAALDGRSEDFLLGELVNRERRYPTCTPEGVAFPHAMLKGIERNVLVVASVRPGVDFGVSGYAPVTLAFGLIGDESRPFEHVKILARLARIARAPRAIGRLTACTDAHALYEQVIAEDRSHE